MPEDSTTRELLDEIKVILEKILPHPDYKNFLIDLEDCEGVLEEDFDAEIEAGSGKNE